LLLAVDLHLHLAMDKAVLPIPVSPVNSLSLLFFINIYSVAQNKIPHQTICNIFATNGQIFKILEAV